MALYYCTTCAYTSTRTNLNARSKALTGSRLAAIELLVSRLLKSLPLKVVSQLQRVAAFLRSIFQNELIIAHPNFRLR